MRRQMPRMMTRIMIGMMTRIMMRMMTRRIMRQGEETGSYTLYYRVSPKT